MICVSQVVYYLCGCNSQLSICRFGSHLTKKPDLGTPKMENALFMGQNENRPPGVARHPKGYARVQYDLVPTNYAMIRAKPSLFDLKAIQPQTW
jgi:hypothetical protein